MRNKAVLTIFWFVSVAIAYASGWFKGVAAAPRIAIEGASLIGYAGLGVLAVLVIGVLYFASGFVGSRHQESIR